VIDPCRRLSPEECSEGTKPTKLMNWAAVVNRVKSPTSAASPIAVSVSIPRMQRSRPINSRCGPSWASREARPRGSRYAGRPDRQRIGNQRKPAAGRATRTPGGQAKRDGSSPSTIRILVRRRVSLAPLPTPTRSRSTDGAVTCRACSWL